MTQQVAELSFRDVLPGTGAHIARTKGASRAPANVVLFSICILALAATAALCAVLGSYLYMGTARPGLPTSVETACRNQPTDAEASCDAQVQNLGFGRWRVTVPLAANQELIVSLKPTLGGAAEPAVLLMRAGHDKVGSQAPLDLKATVLGSAEQSFMLPARTPSRLAAQVSAPERVVAPLKGVAASDGLVRLSIRGANGQAGALILDEVGLFRSEADIRRIAGLYDLRPASRWLVRSALQNILILFLALMVAPAWAGRRWAIWYVPLAAGLASSLVALALLLDSNGPEWALDLPAALAGSRVAESAGSNLNYGIHMAQSILEGKGPLLAGAPPWHRMPGYGYFVAAGSIEGDLLRSALNSICLQIGFVGLTLALLIAAVSRMAPLWVTALAGALLAVAPATPDLTYIEAMAPGLAYLVLGAACLFIADVEARGSARLSRHLALHAAFAIWFAFRVDVLPGWALVSLLLYAWPPRRWTMLGIPAVFMLAVGVPWALFKQQHTGEFSMTTNSAGASLLVGLWEVPHPFVWTIDDASYFRWAESAGLPGASKAASDAATMEVLRFWLTYPGYVVSLAWREFMQFWSAQLASGSWVFAGRGTPSFAESMPYLRLASLAVIAAAAFMRFRPFMILLLGWIVFFDAPIYFLVYSSAGRFYNVALVSVLLLTVLLLCDAQFYRTVLRRPWTVGVTMAVMLAIALAGQKLDATLVAADGFRFAAPFLDPAQSRLAVWRTTESRPDTMLEPLRDLPLADLKPAQDARTKPDDEGIRVVAPAGEARTVATIPLPDGFLSFHACRIRMELKVSHGRVGVGVEPGGGAAPLLSEPARPLATRGLGFVPLDFNVPISGKVSGDRVAQISLRSISEKATDITLRRVTVHGCIASRSDR